MRPADRRGRILSIGLVVVGARGLLPGRLAAGDDVEGRVEQADRHDPDIQQEGEHEHGQQADAVSDAIQQRGRADLIEGREIPEGVICRHAEEYQQALEDLHLSQEK